MPIKFRILSFLLLVVCGCNKYPPLKPNEVATLPVVFHIVHRGEDVGQGDNLSTQAVYQYFELLNANFRNTYTGNSMDVRIQFRLAQYDPNGSPLSEPGIHRVYDPSYNYVYEFDNQDALLKNNFWSSTDYVNVWIVDTYSSSLGLNGINWATFPVMTEKHKLCGLGYVMNLPNENAPYTTDYADGIVISNQLLPNDPTARILAHEFGHYFGLFHVFEDDCTGDGDCLSDTYQYNRNTYNAGTDGDQRYTCGGTWVYADNYMDYYYMTDARFTPQQMERMREALSYSPVRKKARFSTKQKPLADSLGIIFPPPIIMQ